MPRTRHATATRLVRRSQQGDRRAFRALLTSYDWRLRGLAHALLLDPDRVDAVLEAAYLRAWREIVRIGPRDDAAAWLYRIAYNGCIDALRHEISRSGAAPGRAAAPPRSTAAAPVGPGDPADGASGDGSSSTQPGSARVRVADALAGLAPADRVAVVLVDREGFSADAAARILGLTVEAFEAQLAGARAWLSDQLVADAAVRRDRSTADGVIPDGATADEAIPDGATADGAIPDGATADEAIPDGATAQGTDDAGATPPDAGAGPEAAPGDGAASSGEVAAPPDATPSDELAASNDAAPSDEVSASTTDEPATIPEAATSKEPVDAKVASRTGAGPSPNGAQGTNSKANGSEGVGS
jgi:RNA polymerase sigma-70 factor, ECF subfamily